MSNQGGAASGRRPSNSYARGTSRFCGVVRNDVTGKWLAKQGTSRDCFLGSYDTEEEAAIAFDIGCIKQNGYRAITNYDLRCYDVESILNSQKLIQQQQQAALELATMRNDYSLSLLKRPTACRLITVPKNWAMEEQKNQFMNWALENARKGLAKASGSSFQHGDDSPFSSYQESTELKDEENSHGSCTSPIMTLIEHDHNSSETQDIVTYRWLAPDDVSLAKENQLKTQQQGFGDARLSSFKPFNDSRKKGKEKII